MSFENFDWIYYVNRYEDLQNANIDNEIKAQNHWINYGRFENRICNNLSDNISTSFENFDWVYYINRYEDLQNANIDNEIKAKIHWVNHGRFENRICNNLSDNKIINNKIINKICFYHTHANGDCYSTRLIVKHIIKNTKNLNIEYFYTAPKSLSTHCLDIGIKDENFNIIPIIEDKEGILIIDDILYISVWIGYSLSYNNYLCTFCLDGLINYYNYLIELINNKLNLNIKLIDNICTIIPFNYDKYDVDFLKEYIENIKSKYSKIILYSNQVVTTFTKLNEIEYNNNLNYLVTKFKNYFFITFIKSNCNNDNVISIEDILYLTVNNKKRNIGIDYSYLSTICDKVIALNSGLGYYMLNEENKNIHNKILLLSSQINLNPDFELAPFCNVNNLNCINKYNFYIKLYNYINNESLLQEIITFIK